MDDPRARAERYRNGRDGVSPDPALSPPPPPGVDHAAVVEAAIQQAIRQGAFENLPGAGKPIPDLGEHHDPDWWIRRKIRSEQLTGLGPPALLLRVEHAEFADRIDALSSEQDVREHVADFNRRVVEARRQLLGGPPVVTPLHDVESEVAGWRTRRAERIARDRDASEPPPRRRRRLRRPGMRGERT